jgi:hypothetical protein
MEYEIRDWKNFERNTLRAFFTLRMVDVGIDIKDCMMHKQNDKRWITFPSKPWVDTKGNILKDDMGKVKYTPVIKYFNEQEYYRMQEDVLKTIDKSLLGPTPIYEGPVRFR